MAELLDAGGARRYNAPFIETEDPGKFNINSLNKILKKKKLREGLPKTVTLSVVETHDGVECDCIPNESKSMILKVGETIELNHTCHDGRLDKVIATVMSIDVPEKPHPLEHITIRKF